MVVPRLLGLLAFCLAGRLAFGASDETCEAATGKCSGALESASDPPGFFPTTFQEVPVTNARWETRNSKVITFGLPEGVSLALPVSSAIVMNAPGVLGKDGKEVARPYNPISSNSVKGSFDLLIKTYPDGLASKWADGLKPGDLVGFKQGKPQVKKWQYPFGKSSITMLAGGSGIAPMFQALHPLLTTPGDTTKVHLVYGNTSPGDIMLKAELDDFASSYPDRFRVTYVVGKTADDHSWSGKRTLGATVSHEDQSWTGETGWIDEEKVKRLAFPPSSDTVVWICGLDDMYKSLAGSRGAPLKAGSALHNLGYTGDMIWRS